MIAFRTCGVLFLGFCVALLAACQQPAEEDIDTDQLQVNAHLEVARLYQQ